MQATLALVEAARRGGTAELHALVEEVWPDALRIAWTVSHDRAVAEDSAQEACARLLVSLHDLRDARAFRPWFFRLVVNTARQEARRRRSTPLLPATGRGGEEDAAAEPSLDRAERLDLGRAVAALDPLYRLPLVLRYYHDLTSQEIGKVLGLAPGTVRYRLSVARARLRAVLTDGPDRPGAGPSPAPPE